MTYEVIYNKDEQQAPIKCWTRGVPVEDAAKQQLKNIASLPFIHKHIAVMPDVHLGIGATVGSVIPTINAIVPASVGVDLGCGMMAQRTTLTASDLPDNLSSIRSAIESVIPHGRTDNGGSNDRGAWGKIPKCQEAKWSGLKDEFDDICSKHPKIKQSNNISHLGTLGTGNHFYEVCLDTDDNVWLMLHSGSRGVGGKIGSYFISLAKEEMRRWHINLPDVDLAYLPEGSKYFLDYVQAVNWAQKFARINRELMMKASINALQVSDKIHPFELAETAVNCHHNYVTKEHHFGKNVWLTRKGAVAARKGMLGIIPGSMGAKSYIVRGLGNPDSFHSCSHGAGRVMSRTEAKRRFSVEDHIEATKGVECRKDSGVIDETPMAYKPIDDVMNAQKDLVEIVYQLKQVLCIKG